MAIRTKTNNKNEESKVEPSFCEETYYYESLNGRVTCEEARTYYAVRFNSCSMDFQVKLFIYLDNAIKLVKEDPKKRIFK